MLKRPYRHTPDMTSSNGKVLRGLCSIEIILQALTS